LVPRTATGFVAFLKRGLVMLRHVSSSPSFRHGMSLHIGFGLALSRPSGVSFGGNCLVAADG
jgi:hypothetical protein